MNSTGFITHKRSDVFPAAHKPTPDAGMTLQGGRCPQLFVLLLFQEFACKTLVPERLFFCLQHVQFGGIFRGGLSPHCLQDLTSQHSATKLNSSSATSWRLPPALSTHHTLQALEKPGKSTVPASSSTASLQKMNTETIRSSLFSNG